MAEPTAQEFFSAGASDPGAQAGGAPTAAQFFAPMSGAAQDTVWSSLKSAGARILNSAGYGARQTWGADTPDLDEGSITALRKAGVFNDYTAGHQAFLKSANEALLRGATAAAEVVYHAPGTVIGALAGGAEQAAQEIRGAQPGPVRSALAAPLAGAAEIGHGALEGAFGELPAFGEEAATARSVGITQSERLQQAAKARSVGVVGEGEAGYYDAQPVTPENVQARADAAQEAGVAPAAVEPEPAPAPDIHEVARRIDPETFEQFDAITAERDLHRQTVADLAAERAKSPEALEAQTRIDTILGKVHGVEDRLTNAGRERLARAQAQLDAALNTDTPEMAAARGKLMDADFAMRDLAPQVSQAYRHAAELMPEQPEPVKPATGGAGEGGAEPQAQATPAPVTPESEAHAAAALAPERPAPAVAAEASVAGEQAAEPSVTGEQKLGEPNAEPARPPAEGEPTGTAAAPEVGTVSPKPVEGTGELATRGLSEGVEAKAIADGLAGGFGDLPEYRTLNMADQVAKVVALMDKDYEGAKAVAMGTKAPPKGILPVSVFVGVEKRALLEGDVETLRQLATRSKLSTAVTTAAQTIRTLGERDQASPVGAILDVQKARETALAKRMDIEAAKAETVNEIRVKVREAAAKPEAWADFIQSITCGE